MFVNKSTTYKIGTGVAFIGMVVVNALANIIHINGVGTGEVSDSYPNLFAPAGYTFSIWGLIYILLGAYVLYQFGLFHREKPNESLFKKIAPYFILSSLANIIWIFAWHYHMITLTVFLMVIILLSLIIIANTLKSRKLNKRDKWFVRVPFSIYFGWITVATIANVTTWLVSINWDGLGISEATWTVIVLVVGLVIGVLTIYKNRDAAYGAVIIWAYAGILTKHISPAGFAGNYLPIIVTTILSILLLGLTIFWMQKHRGTGGLCSPFP